MFFFVGGDLRLKTNALYGQSWIHKILISR